MQKNVASQKLMVFAFDSTTNLPKTGDAANLTAYVSIDYGTVTVLGDTSATEMDATNAKGYYLFDLTQAETNGNTLLFTAKSSTSNIVVIGAPATVFTTAANFSNTVITSGGTVNADAKAINAVATTSVTTVSAFIGSTGAAINGTNANTLSSHDPGATLGTSTLTQTQVTGGAYALNSASFAFNAALDFTTTQKAATLARVTLVDTATTVTNQLTAAAIATGVWQDATSGDFTVASSIGKSLYTAGVVPGGSGGILISGSNTGTTTLGALTVSGATTLTGAVSLGSTLGVTGTTTLAAINTGAIGTSNITVTGTLSTSGTATFNAITVSNALTVSGGATITSSTGNGLTLSSTGANGDGLHVTGNGSGDGAHFEGGATGRGAHFLGGSTSGDGVDFVSQTSGNGATYTGAGAGTGIAANITGNITGTVSSLVSPGNIWDVVLASHLTAGSTGFALNAAGSAGDPWGTALPGAYGAGTAGHILGTGVPDIAPGSANGLLKAGSNAATTFATLTSTGAFTINGVSDVAQTGDSYARIGATGSGLTSLAPASTALSTAVWTAPPSGFLSATFPSGTITNNTTTPSWYTAPSSVPTVSQIATAVWQDTTAGDFTVASSIGKSLYTTGATPGAAGGLFIAGTNAATTVTTAFTTTFTGNLTGNVGGSVAGSVASVTAGVTLATGAITDTAIATTGANRLADTNRRRLQANVEASAYGDALSVLSEYGFIQQAQESTTVTTPGLLTILKTDGTTVLGTRTITTDPAAEPVTGIE